MHDTGRTGMGTVSAPSSKDTHCRVQDARDQGSGFRVQGSEPDDQGPSTRRDPVYVICSRLQIPVLLYTWGTSLASPASPIHTTDTTNN